MPGTDVLGAIRGKLTLEDVLMLTHRWRVSAMTLNLRVYRLGAIPEWTYSTLAKQLSMAGFRRGQPGSDLLVEAPSLLAQVMSDMRTRRWRFSDIARILNVRPMDIQDLMLGIVTFAIQGEGRDQSHRRGDRRDAPLASVADIGLHRPARLGSVPEPRWRFRAKWQEALTGETLRPRASLAWESTLCQHEAMHEISVVCSRGRGAQPADLEEIRQ